MLCNKKVLKECVLQSATFNTCDILLERLKVNQQMIWLAAHMHIKIKGFVFQKGKCSFPFHALDKIEKPNSHEVIEVLGTVTDEQMKGMYRWSSFNKMNEFICDI